MGQDVNHLRRQSCFLPRFRGKRSITSINQLVSAVRRGKTPACLRKNVPTDRLRLIHVPPMAHPVVANIGAGAPVADMSCIMKNANCAVRVVIIS